MRCSGFRILGVQGGGVEGGGVQGSGERREGPPTKRMADLRLKKVLSRSLKRGLFEPKNCPFCPRKKIPLLVFLSSLQNGLPQRMGSTGEGLGAGDGGNIGGHRGHENNSTKPSRVLSGGASSWTHEKKLRFCVRREAKFWFSLKRHSR